MEVGVADIGLHECKSCRGDNIYRWNYECKFVNPNTEWKDDSQSQEGCQERNFPTWQWSQTHCKNHTRVFKEEKSENYDLAKYVPWPESNRTPLEYFKEEGRATQLLQQRTAEKNCLCRVTEHLSTDLCKTGIIHAQEDPICQKQRRAYKILKNKRMESH